MIRQDVLFYASHQGNFVGQAETERGRGCTADPFRERRVLLHARRSIRAEW